MGAAVGVGGMDSAVGVDEPITMGVAAGAVAPLVAAGISPKRRSVEIKSAFDMFASKYNRGPATRSGHKFTNPGTY